MEQFLDQLIDKYNLHDIDTLIIKNGKVVREYITSNKTITIDPLKRTDLYRIASISKLFVGIAIMQLQEKGLLDLHDNIENYIPFPLRNKNHPNEIITLQHLLTHTSSLRGTEFYYVPYNEESKELFFEGGKYYSNKMYSSYKPGESYSYYNAGFHLLAMAIELVTNTRFDVFIEKSILRPLGMKGSFNSSESYTYTHLRPIYRLIDKEWTPQCDFNVSKNDFSDYRLGTNGSLFGPQGSMRSNALELSKLMMDLMSDESRLLSKESLDYMMKIHYLDTSKTLVNYDFYRNSGIAFNVINNLCINKPIPNMNYTLIGHCGLAYGFHGIFFFDKVNRNGVIFNVTGEGKPMSEYYGKRSQFFQFQEDIFEFVHKEIWKQ